MPQDHYVAQTYLQAFTDPKNPDRLHAYRKTDSGYFTPSPASVCKSLNWDQIPKYLSPPDALGQWLQIFEPHWADAIARLGTDQHLSAPDKHILAGYWAYLSTCTPTWHRVTTAIQQADIDDKVLGGFIEHVKAHPEKYPNAASYMPEVEAGTFKIEIDKNYPRAMVATHLLKHQWALYHQGWSIIWNETNELLLTSDNPSCFDFEYGTPFMAARYLPLTPRLALWTKMNDPNNLPEMTPDLPPIGKCSGHKATLKFVRDMNRLIIQSAENIVLSSELRPFIPACIEKYKGWRVRTLPPIRIPADDDAYYEVTQTRAAPEPAGA